MYIIKYKYHNTDINNIILDYLTGSTNYWKNKFNNILNNNLLHCNVDFNITKLHKNNYITDLAIIRNKIIFIFGNNDIIKVDITIDKKYNKNRFKIKICLKKKYHHSLVSKKNNELRKYLANTKYNSSASGPEYYDDLERDNGFYYHNIHCEFIIKSRF